jgi:uncharacterized membrane protein
MLALRYAYVLALVVWLGGMAVLNMLVAPTTFDVLQAGAPLVGRALAESVIGTTLARFHYVEYGCGAVLLLSFVAMGLLGPRPANFAVRAAIIVVMLGAALYSGLAGLNGADHVRAFLVTGRLMGVDIVGALVLLYWEAREHAE